MDINTFEKLNHDGQYDYLTTESWQSMKYSLLSKLMEILSLKKIELKVDVDSILNITPCSIILNSILLENATPFIDWVIEDYLGYKR